MTGVQTCALPISRAFRVLHERGQSVVTAEADDANLASGSLLLSLGASRQARFVEVVRRVAGAGEAAS